MKQFINTYWKTLLFFAAVGLIGGFLVGLSVLDSYPADIKQLLYEELDASGLNQFPAELVVGVSTAIQSAAYGIVLGAVGILLGKKTGLWKDERTFEKKPLVSAGAVALIGGIGIIVPDFVFFGKYSQAIMDSYAVKPTFTYIIGAVTYGGVIEEVMLRLFTMSLVAFIIHIFFRKKHEKPTTWMLVTANIISALLFSAGHLPSTAVLLGITPMIVFRCFLLNGTFGLLFGWLYRKYGLRYAMLAHGGCHVISKLIWILFI